jgi:hypothetical protein
MIVAVERSGDALRFSFLPFCSCFTPLSITLPSQARVGAATTLPVAILPGLETYLLLLIKMIRLKSRDFAPVFLAADVEPPKMAGSLLGRYAICAKPLVYCLANGRCECV